MFELRDLGHFTFGFHKEIIGNLKKTYALPIFSAALRLLKLVRKTTITFNEIPGTLPGLAGPLTSIYFYQAVTLGTYLELLQDNCTPRKSLEHKQEIGFPPWKPLYCGGEDTSYHSDVRNINICFPLQTFQKDSLCAHHLSASHLITLVLLLQVDK